MKSRFRILIRIAAPICSGVAATRVFVAGMALAVCGDHRIKALPVEFEYVCKAGA
ncbi:hypothetical protein [Paraburkholderia sp.]|uniref:hypothetical protein n=1 Tax=Paraburkholderia sp. TaxID=1926495 RepID=UPI0025F89DD8|nr:hypothetical protein [Paraburkholderia sp.]